MPFNSATFKELKLPYRAIKTNVGDFVNVVVRLERRPGRRFVSKVVEIHGYDPDRDEYNGFIFDRHSGCGGTDQLDCWNVTRRETC